jgi:hypothetical protein
MSNNVISIEETVLKKRLFRYFQSQDCKDLNDLFEMEASGDKETLDGENLLEEIDKEIDCLVSSLRK